MGKIEFSTCQDVRNQKKIQELDCPRCHEPGGIEAFVKDGILAEDGVCDNCGYILPEGTELRRAAAPRRYRQAQPPICTCAAECGMQRS